MAGASASELLKAIMKGSARSARVFGRATAGCRLSDASEHFLTAGIFEAVSKCGGFAHLEVSVADCLRDAKAVRLGRPSAKERRTGRFDLVLYRANESPRAAIEVKNGVRHAIRSRLVKDFDRLISAMCISRKSTYQFCAFVYFATADYNESRLTKTVKSSTKSRLQGLMNRVSGLAEEAIHSSGRPLISRAYSSAVSFSPDADEGAWAIGLIVFADKNAAGTFTHSLLDS